MAGVEGVGTRGSSSTSRSGRSVFLCLPTSCYTSYYLRVPMKLKRKDEELNVVKGR